MRSLALTLLCLPLVTLATHSSHRSHNKHLDDEHSESSLSLRDGCTQLYTVVKGDTCNAILAKFRDPFSLSDFYAANPAVNHRCTNLQIGQNVCVSGPKNLATGTWSFKDGCRKYHHHTQSDEDCEQLAQRHGISIMTFTSSTSPSAKSGRRLTPGRDYCVGGRPASPGAPGRGSSQPGSSPAQHPGSPSSQQPGTLPDQQLGTPPSSQPGSLSPEQPDSPTAEQPGSSSPQQPTRPQGPKPHQGSHHHHGAQPGRPAGGDAPGNVVAPALEPSSAPSSSALSPSNDSPSASLLLPSDASSLAPSPVSSASSASSDASLPSIASLSASSVSRSPSTTYPPSSSSSSCTFACPRQDKNRNSLVKGEDGRQNKLSCTYRGTNNVCTYDQKNGKLLSTGNRSCAKLALSSSCTTQLPSSSGVVSSASLSLSGSSSASLSLLPSDSSASSVASSTASSEASSITPSASISSDLPSSVALSSSAPTPSGSATCDWAPPTFADHPCPVNAVLDIYVNGASATDSYNSASAEACYASCTGACFLARYADFSCLTVEAAPLGDDVEPADCGASGAPFRTFFSTDSVATSANCVSGNSYYDEHFGCQSCPAGQITNKAGNGCVSCESSPSSIASASAPASAFSSASDAPSSLPSASSTMPPSASSDSPSSAASSTAAPTSSVAPATYRDVFCPSNNFLTVTGTSQGAYHVKSAEDCYASCTDDCFFATWYSSLETCITIRPTALTLKYLVCNDNQAYRAFFSTDTVANLANCFSGFSYYDDHLQCVSCPAGQVTNAAGDGCVLSISSISSTASNDAASVVPSADPSSSASQPSSASSTQPALPSDSSASSVASSTSSPSPSLPSSSVSSSTSATCKAEGASCIHGNQCCSGSCLGKISKVCAALTTPSTSSSSSVAPLPSATCVALGATCDARSATAPGSSSSCCAGSCETDLSGKSSICCVPNGSIIDNPDPKVCCSGNNKKQGAQYKCMPAPATPVAPLPPATPVAYRELACPAGGQPKLYVNSKSKVNNIKSAELCYAEATGDKIAALYDGSSCYTFKSANNDQQVQCGSSKGTFRAYFTDKNGNCPAGTSYYDTSLKCHRCSNDQVTNDNGSGCKNKPKERRKSRHRRAGHSEH